MADAWQFQIRINVSADLAASLRNDPTAAGHPTIRDVLRAHNATVKSQFDAFAEYVSEAERTGKENFPLYRWTKETIGNPEKKTKYLQVFTVSVDGREIYGEDAADPLQAQLSALGEDAGIKSVSKLDSNPANNPQPPRRFQ
ncbi:MAG TPA: hypothetical protein VGC69_10760 [Bordetella sp.]